MKNVLIIGAGVLDVLVRPVKPEVFEKGSVPVEDIRFSTGGDGLNEATVLARLLADERKNNEKAVRLLTLTGKDQAGEMILSHCGREGICTELSVSEEGLSTGINIVMIQENGERSFFTNPKSSLRRLSIEHMPERFPEDVKILSFASIFVSPLFTGKELAELFRRAREQGICICADMTKRKNNETIQDIGDALSMVDHLFANREEAGLLTGKTAAEEMAEELWRWGVKNVIIKCGGAGCFVRNGKTAQWFPAVKDTICVDTTGAGDSFAAGFLSGLAEEVPLLECIRRANACGSLAVEKQGACRGIRNRAQMEERMKKLQY